MLDVGWAVGGERNILFFEQTGSTPHLTCEMDSYWMNEHYWKPPASNCRKGLMRGPVFDQYYVLCFMICDM